MRDEVRTSQKWAGSCAVNINKVILQCIITNFYVPIHKAMNLYYEV